MAGEINKWMEMYTSLVQALNSQKSLLLKKGLWGFDRQKSFATFTSDVPQGGARFDGATNWTAQVSRSLGESQSAPLTQPPPSAHGCVSGTHRKEIKTATHSLVHVLTCGIHSQARYSTVHLSKIHKVFIKICDGQFDFQMGRYVEKWLKSKTHKDTTWMLSDCPN